MEMRCAVARFFFQAEDGIRDIGVTGVQTCALPILRTGAGIGMEIITGVERRRRWRDEEKLRILAELDEPGVKFSDVARRHDVSRGLLWQWRDARRRGKLVAEAPGFMQLQVVPELPAVEPAKGSGRSEEDTAELQSRQYIVSR